VWVLLCLPAVLLLAAPAAGAATRYVAPNGSDAGACLSSPCASFAHAYGQSSAGDVIRVAAGAYGAQDVPAGSKAVVFAGAGGPRVSELDNSAANVRFDGINVEAGFEVTAAFENHGADNVTFRNGRIGNVTNEKGALVSGSNFTFDRVVFHDVRVTNETVHNECVYAIGVPGMTVRNSSFYNCATMDLFFTYGDWWEPAPPGYGNITLENNVFGHTYKDDGTWHYYSLAVGHTGPQSQGWGSMAGWVVRNNTFEIPAAIGDKSASGGSRWVGNLGDWDCIPGMAFRHNVGLKCHSSDKRVSPPASSASAFAPFGWASPLGQDFRLKAGSPAIGAADPNDHPATDRDGYVRDSRPDAGAHEFGAGPPRSGAAPGEPARPGEPRRRRTRMRAVRLRPRVICRRGWRSCPRAARLSATVGAGARLTVRVRRLQRGHRPRPVRSRTLRVHGRRAAVRIRARGLARGRYRVLVSAARAGRLRSPAKALALRVR
jgi:hypothetical protein